MKLRKLLSCFGVMAWICGGSAVPSFGAEVWRFPGEYESHQAMWMLWPTYEYKAGFPSTDPIAEMIRAMSGHTHVNLGVQDAADKAAAKSLLMAKGVPLGHVHFFTIPHADIWARDMGPAFTRSSFGNLRINDWNFNAWGYEEPDSEFSTIEEAVDRKVASAIFVPVLTAQAGPVTGVRMIHEGGAPTHNGRGTMIIAESVVMQRNLGPNRFCGGAEPIPDFTYTFPNTYLPSADWPACKLLVEKEYQRMLGVQKVIWIPTGVVEDTATFRGPLAPDIRIPDLNGDLVSHDGVYTVYTVEGHSDETVRFVAPNKVVLAEEKIEPLGSDSTEIAALRLWIQTENKKRLDGIHAILSAAKTESGQPIQIVRIPTPQAMFDVFHAGDGTFDYFQAYGDYKDGSVFPQEEGAGMLGVLAASYVNYVPTNDVVLVSRFAKDGLPAEIHQRDEQAREALKNLFPGRQIVQIDATNVNRGGGGMNCITQQQPASATFAQLCGWAKVQVAAQSTSLFASSLGSFSFGSVSRISGSGNDIYLQRLALSAGRVQVRVGSGSPLSGKTGWVNADQIESAGEKCPGVYWLR